MVNSVNDDKTTISPTYYEDLMNKLDDVSIGDKSKDEKLEVREKIKKAFESTGRFDEVEKVKEVERDEESTVNITKRNNTTREERLDVVTGRMGIGYTGSSKVAKLFSNDNVDKYVKAQYLKAFSNVISKSSIMSEDEFVREMVDYLTLCYSTKTIPTTAGLANYIGVSENSIFNYKNDPDSKFYNATNNFYSLINDMMLLAAFDGTMPTNLYTFLSKNWFGYNSSENLVLSLNPLNARAEESDSIKVIEEQLKLEDNSK